MKIYDEENMPFDDENDDMSGFSVNEDNSIFRRFIPEPEPETIATPIPENELTVILSEANTALLRDGEELTLVFAAGGCDVCRGTKKVGSLKAAFVEKLRAARGGQLAQAFYKKDVPPMVRIVFGSGAPVPASEE